MKRRRKGFTLVELMVVIAIMAILSAASIPVFTGYVRKAKAAVHLSECRSVYMAAQTYLEELRMEGRDAADVDTEKLLLEIRELTGMENITYVEGDGTGVESRDMSEDFGIVLETAEEGAACTAVIYNGEGGWIFDAREGSYTELK